MKSTYDVRKFHKIFDNLASMHIMDGSHPLPWHIRENAYYYTLFCDSTPAYCVSKYIEDDLRREGIYEYFEFINKNIDFTEIYTVNKIVERSYK